VRHASALSKPDILCLSAPNRRTRHERDNSRQTRRPLLRNSQSGIVQEKLLGHTKEQSSNGTLKLRNGTKRVSQLLTFCRVHKADSLTLGAGVQSIGFAVYATVIVRAACETCPAASALRATTSLASNRQSERTSNGIPIPDNFKRVGYSQVNSSSTHLKLGAQPAVASATDGIPGHLRSKESSRMQKTWESV
jgi:hypothetical protein